MNTHVETGEKSGGLLQRWWLQLRQSPMREACARGAVWATLLLAVALVAYWGYGEHRKRTLQKIAVTLVQDASARMHEALRSEVDASRGDARILADLEQHAIAADRSLTKLRDMDTATFEELAAAADDYLLTAREILRRRSSDYRYRNQVSDSLGSLRAHMGADNRTGAWISQAVRSKARLDADFRRYRMTAAALADLLAQYSGSRLRIAAYVEPSRLVDEQAAGAARTRLLDALGKLSNEVERANQLNAYR